jgi:hypothetical protein
VDRDPKPNGCSESGGLCRRVQTHGRIAGIVNAKQAPASSEDLEAQLVTVKGEKGVSNQYRH